MSWHTERNNHRQAQVSTTTWTFSQPKLLPHQTPNSHCPSVQFKRLIFPERCAVSLQEKPAGSIGTKEEKKTKKQKTKTEADERLQESTRGCRQEKSKQTPSKEKAKTSKTQFLVIRLLRTPRKTAGGKFPWDSWVLALASPGWDSREDEGSDLCVMVRVSGWSVGRRRRIGLDPPALHVRDELIWDLS